MFAVKRRPRPWRSREEAQMIRRFVFWWFTGRGSKPSGRAWAKKLGISHTWLQKLVRKFGADPNEMLRLQVARGDPTSAELSRAQEYTRQMRERGELRPARRPRGIWRRTAAGYGSNGMARSPSVARRSDSVPDILAVETAIEDRAGIRLISSLNRRRNALIICRCLGTMTSKAAITGLARFSAIR